MSSHKFSPSNIKWLDYPDRVKEYDISGIIASIGLEPGMSVADIGAGTGFFSFPFSVAVGPDGKVMAIDISPEMLETLGAKVTEGELTNIEAMASTEESIPAENGSADLAFMSNVFHELDGDSTLLEVRRILKPGGKLAIIDWKKKREEDGPPYHHRLSAGQVISRCRDAGFTFAGEFKTGSERRYGLIFQMKP